MATRPVTTWDVLDGHVTLDLQCLDRIYLNGYVPNLQVGGQIVQFLAGQGFPIPSPAVVARIGDRFRDAVRRLADTEHIPVVRFAKHARKLDVMRPHLARQSATGRSGIAGIGVAQEFQWVASCSSRPARGPGAPHFQWGRAERRVSCFYFYLWDEEFGPAFVKICSYLPYPIKIWLNGHEWAKQQAARAGIGFTALANGFASSDDPAGLQAICDRLGPADIAAFADRWWPRLPLPLTAADHGHGYWWELSMRQVEVSRTLVFDQPRNGRAFFETLVADNLDLGRPEKVELIFGRRIPKDSTATGVFATRVVTRGVDVTINVGYKHSRVKEYFKEGRALRIETVINDPNDLGVLRRIVHLDELVGKARAVNRRLLDAERVGQGCVLASPAFERIARPSLVDGRRAPALRFGDPRVMALAGALAVSSNLVGGFSNKTIRPLVGGLLGEPYDQVRCCYDLRCLKLKGLIRKVPHTNTYVLTPDGQRFAIFYTKVGNRVLRPLLAADQIPAPLAVRQSLRTLDRAVTDYLTYADRPA
jgi:tRNA (Thr-GGU) A37 N-methylase